MLSCQGREQPKNVLPHHSFPTLCWKPGQGSGRGDRKGRVQRRSRNHHYSQRTWLSLEQNLKEETKMVIAKLQVDRQRP